MKGHVLWNYFVEIDKNLILAGPVISEFLKQKNVCSFHII